MILPEPYYHDDAAGITIYCGDCREILPLLQPESVDLVLTDPPYGLGDKWKGKRDSVWKLDRAEVMAWDGDTSAIVTTLPDLAHACIVWGGATTTPCHPFAAGLRGTRCKSTLAVSLNLHGRTCRFPPAHSV